ncbi:MAG TPA: amidohydrolase family protein [Roseiarcus sp.]|nr:amidohydrolase family protein [Roseiarcus sp.]
MTASPVASPEGTILTPKGWVRGRVDIVDREIATVRGDVLPAGAKPEGPFILPGFIDLHVHGGGGADWQDGEEGIRNFVRFHTSHGTTAIAPTTATGPVRIIERALSDIASIAEKRRPGEAVVLGAHLEGPFVSPQKPGAMNIAYMLEGDGALAKSWAEKYKIVVATVAPEIPGGHDVGKALAERGCRVQVGHSIATPPMVEEAFQHGFSGFTHLFNAMSQMEHRSPGVAAYALAKARYAEIISDLVHVDETVLLAAYRAIPRLYAITDASAAGMPDGNYQWGGHRIIKKGLRITLENGVTLAGSAITMLDALRNLIKIGLTIEQASDMTSARPAEYLGLKDLGRIEPGARACFVKLDHDLTLQGVWVDGESAAPATETAQSR